ncbi:DNA repair protein RecN (Recombination protein N) [Paucidesulfovibrio gracilis DSM 16080]|uniref:DNA repair protein RecN n=1 Tax=Paucidesulfovibrio gracilis DSM 16080 TaxID=1121449 RepID=A0A1T4W8X4_9BACT|nr:AAA family ATPase [Paucidesulfovibrio gracilis]SKA73720.1 DNA repair protein RecN (Recombination protein N) [Paucidesulfovibrio gracilis DSM 16080]
MLELLRIHDLALIEDAELEFSAGLTVLTGETGAGKSFILRALDFLTGERMRRDMIRPGKEKAVVEALFVQPDGDLLIRRELSAETGRSRIYINDRLSSQEAIRELRPSLIVHTSQHGQQKLLSPAFQMRVVDEFLPDPALLTQRHAAMEELEGLITQRKELEERAQGLVNQRELLEFQREEIEKVDPQPGEEEELEALKQRLKDQELATQSLGNALDLLHGDISLADRLSALSRQMDEIARMYPDFAEDRDAVDTFRHQLDDLDARLRRNPAGEEEEGDLDAVEARLFEFSRLCRKLNRSMNEILRLKDEIAENLSFLDACELDRKRLAKQEQEAAGRLGEILQQLNAARQKAAQEFCRRVEQELHGLGFSEHARVDMHFEAHEPYPGLEELRGRLLWIPNPGQAPQPLDRIASGGELSRFLLALVSIRTDRSESLPSLLFDEVDAGVGGLTLNSLGDKLQALARRQQVLLITHWPQLAALAKRHFLIAKEVQDGQTFTRCRRLDADGVRRELSRMAGGGDKGQALAGRLI